MRLMQASNLLTLSFGAIITGALCIVWQSPWMGSRVRWIVFFFFTCHFVDVGGFEKAIRVIFFKFRFDLVELLLLILFELMWCITVECGSSCGSDFLFGDR
jgi:hypothetical protein